MAETNRRSVLITGASTGIGRATVIELACNGFDVFAGVRRVEDGASVETEAGKLAGANGQKSLGTVSSVLLDVTDESSITAAVAQVSQRVGDNGLAAVINNAGISVVGPVEFVPLANWRRQFEINFFGLIGVTQAALPLLRMHVAKYGSGSARVVNISSIAGRIAQPIVGPYTASKFAVESLTDSLRMELRGQGILVCSVNPGAIDTPIWSKAHACMDTIKPDHPARALYGPLIDGVTAAADRAHASAGPVSSVTRAVLACLSAKNPSARYFVGRDAKSGALAKRFIPDKLFDRILAMYFSVRK